MADQNDETLYAMMMTRQAHVTYPTDEAIRTAWDAYARTHFKLEGTVPTELEYAGMKAALEVGIRESIPDVLRGWRGNESVVVSKIH